MNQVSQFRWASFVERWNPACDVEEAKDGFLFSMDLPGVPQDKLKVEVLGDQLTISGERPTEERASALYSERRHGRFQRTFTLGADLDADRVEATLRDGVLRIRVPKSAAVQPKLIKIAS